MEERFKAGYLAISKAGHDAGNVYVILDSDATFVYLVDGRIRTMDKPKRKKKFHVQLIQEEALDITDKLNKGQQLMNEDIRRVIKNYSLNHI